MINIITSFIYANWITIIVIVLAVIYIGYFVVTKQYAKIRSVAYALMLQAERILTTSPGKEKFEAVFNELYSRIPKWIRLFVSQQTLKEELQKWYDLAKDYLDDTKVNGSVE